MLSYFTTDITLNRGGKVGVHSNMLSHEKKDALTAAMNRCNLFRQYTRNEVFFEPRFHVLLSSKASQYDVGYMYHGIKMKALSIDLVPEVASYAKELARLYKLPHDQWNIGVDLIVYKDGEDSIGWHADDNQGKH
jgi:alkylated DNA repair dioxygenase AlkB